MKQPLYIISASAISPQHSFDAEHFLEPVLSSKNNTLYVTEPDYRTFINPVAIRRMSRIIKMGISAGMKSLQDAGVTMPNGIIIGTGRGSVSDTEHFLNDMLKYEEQALNPTYFIQSTYNSINGWLAMQTKCKGYNQTYVHRGHSFELCLLDAQLHFSEASEACTLLLGCFDEMSPDYYTVKSKVGYWKETHINSADLLDENDTNGTIGGEGVAFFTVSNKPANAICSLQQLKMLQGPNADTIQQAVHAMTNAEGIDAEAIDVAICGFNGDSRQQWIYTAVEETLAADTTLAGFKHLCGEYDTSSGFALWLATRMFANQQIPESTIIREGRSTSIKYMLIANHYILDSVSLMLLKIS